MRCSPTVKLSQRRSAQALFERAEEPPPPGGPGPVSHAGQEGEHDVEPLLNRRRFRGVAQLENLRGEEWRGRTSLADVWRPRRGESDHCRGLAAE